MTMERMGAGMKEFSEFAFNRAWESQQAMRKSLEDKICERDYGKIRLTTIFTFVLTGVSTWISLVLIKRSK